MFRDRKLLLLASAAMVVRAAFLFLWRLDSDEPQHLHVVWAWSQGLTQYRDVFDNHFPLLHLLFAPLMSVMPESSATFLWMRLAIAPFAIGCSWLLYVIGKPLIGARGAVIAAILFSVMPPWLAKSVEFRNDTLWIFFWLVAMALIVAPKRAMWFLAGVVAALSVLASVKALPLLLAHALAIASQRRPIAFDRVMRLACGAAIPILAVIAFFASRGALDEMLHQTLLLNAQLPVHVARRVGGAVAFAVIAPVFALRTARAGHSFIGHFAHFAVWYSLVLLCFWPSLTPRDFLPLVPLAALVIGASRIGRSAPVAMFVIAAFASVYWARLWRPLDTSRARFVDAVVARTSPDDVVFDLKGDAVFRRRAVFRIYDIVGRTLTNNGTLADRGPEELIASRCCVAMKDADYIPPRTRAFLNAHFVDAGDLRVCSPAVRDLWSGKVDTNRQVSHTLAVRALPRDQR